MANQIEHLVGVSIVITVQALCSGQFLSNYHLTTEVYPDTKMEELTIFWECSQIISAKFSGSLPFTPHSPYQYVIDCQREFVNFAQLISLKCTKHRWSFLTNKCITIVFGPAPILLRALSLDEDIFLLFSPSLVKPILYHNIEPLD